MARTSIMTRLLKLTVLPAIIAAALLLGTFGTNQPEEAKANPVHVVALNFSHCTALGSAFGGIPATTAALGCTSFNQQDLFQTYMGCLLKLDPDGPDKLPGTGDEFSCGTVPAEPVRPATNALAGLDLDGNKAFAPQPYLIVAWVDDDAPVRFTTDLGNFEPAVPGPVDKDVYCEPGGADYGTLEPDCDNDPATVGDGVVVAKFIPSVDDGITGTVHINVVQDGIAFPVELTLTGPPDTIVLEPLFGKDTIQTGATRATPGNCPADPPAVYPIQCQLPDDTDCNFSASVSGVIGAIGKESQTIVFVRALDDNGEEVSGALLDWFWNSDDLVNGYPDPADGTFALHRTDTGGVALPQTPTVDTGTLGIGFPQFVCGGADTGVIDLDVKFNAILAPGSDPAEHQTVQINVVSHAADIALTANPAVIDCNGINTSAVTANVTTADGGPVADGLDIEFDVVALGTANPLKVDSAAGAGGTVVTPLADTGTLGVRGVTVTARVRGDITEHSQYFEDLLIDGLTEAEEDLALEDPDSEPHQTHQIVERSILVECSGAVAAPEPAPGGDGGGAGAPTGSITPPDTGSAQPTPMMAFGWSVALLAMAGAVLTGATVAARRN